MAGYRGGGTRGGKWGCLAAAVVATPLLCFLIIGDALGDCVSGEECHKGFLANVALPTIAVGLLVGLLVRAAVNWLGRRGS